MAVSKAFKLQEHHNTLWAYLSSSTTSSGGGGGGNTNMCYGSHSGIPHQATSSAQKGELNTEATTSGAAQTSPPEGVLRRMRHMKLDEMLGHTTARLGYTGQTKAYAIGGTAELALPYSINSASTAGPTHYQ
jgi:hypothetical protein